MPSLFRTCACTLVIAALGTLSTACSPLVDLGESAPPKSIYRLNALHSEAAGANTDWRLTVVLPDVAGGLDTNRIALKTGTYEIKYYAGARWADRVPEMLQSLLIDSFEGMGIVAFSGAEPAGLSGFILQADIREFQADVSRGTPEITVRLGLKLMTSRPMRLVAATTVTTAATAAGDSAPTLVAGFDDALQEALAESVRWTARNAARHLSAEIVE